MCEDMVDGSEWEHKFSQSSEWVDLVVVRHHGSGNRHSLRTQVM